MGLLSRKKTVGVPSTIMHISSPQQVVLPPTPSEYGFSDTGSSSGVYGEMTNIRESFEVEGRPSMEKVAVNNYGALPSPPGSPVAVGAKVYPLRTSPATGYTSSSQPRPLHTPHTQSGVAISNAYASSTSNGSPERRELTSTTRPLDLNRTTPSSFSTHSDLSTASNSLYNNGTNDYSSSATTVSDTEVDGRMGNLGLETAVSGDRTSCDSIAMEDIVFPASDLISEEGDIAHSSDLHTAELVPIQQLPTPPATITRPISSSTVDSSILSPTPSLASSSVARKTSSRYNLADFTFIRTLGTGSFGRVHLVRSQHNSRSYAVKVLSKDRVVKMKQVEHTNSEREMLERVRHPFLVNLWGTFKDSKNLYMVMDFVAGGELFSLLRKSQRFPDPVAKFFAAEVALALDYLHSLDIIYRDLKPENILLGADGHVKITDFGFAKHVPDITWTLCGTPDYLAPEIVQSRGYNKSVDWYALGVLIFEMLAGYPPFFTEDANPMRLYEKIIAGKVRYPAYFFPEAKDLLKSLLTPDITKRYGNLANGSRDIFGHVWFQEVDWERLYRKEIPAPYVPKVESEGDASNFDHYPEVDMSEYGSTGSDPHGHHFPSF